MLEPEGRQSADVLGPGLVALSDELVQRRVHIDRVPKHDQIDHESERAELVLLTFAVALAKLAFTTRPSSWSARASWVGRSLVWSVRVRPAARTTPSSASRRGVADHPSAGAI